MVERGYSWLGGETVMGGEPYIIMGPQTSLISPIPDLSIIPD